MMPKEFICFLQDSARAIRFRDKGDNSFDKWLWNGEWVWDDNVSCETAADYYSDPNATIAEPAQNTTQPTKITSLIRSLTLSPAMEEEHDCSAEHVIRAITAMLGEIVLKDDAECEKLQEWEQGCLELKCKITGQHTWEDDQCGYWGHQYCTNCRQHRYPDLGSLSCSEAVGKIGPISEAEFNKRKARSREEIRREVDRLCQKAKWPAPKAAVSPHSSDGQQCPDGEIKMSSFRSRLFEERNQLNERIEKLRAFILDTKFEELPDIERNDLREQITYMVEYSKVLERRAARLCNNA